MLVDSPRRRGIDAALLKTLVDQFVERDVHPLCDIRPFEELVLGLIDRVDPAAASDILQPLCAHPDTPAGVLARISQLRGEIMAAGAARRSIVTGVPPLVENVKALDIDRLRELAADLSVNFDPPMRRTLTIAAREDLTLARILIDRDDSGFDPAAFFLAATRLERLAIILDACRQSIADGGDESFIADPALSLQFEMAAAAQNIDRMAEIAATRLHLHHSLARMIVSDATGEALALLMVAMGFDPIIGMRVFTGATSGGSHNFERVKKLVALMRATPRRAAMEIVTAIAGDSVPLQATSGLASRREKTATSQETLNSFASRKLPGAA